MNEISRSSIFRSKIKQEAAKGKEEPKVHIGVIRAKKRYTFTDAVKMVQKNNVAVIFESPEEEKQFSEIAQRINFIKSEDDKIIER